LLYGPENDWSNRPNCSKCIAIIAIGKSIYLLFFVYTIQG